MGGARVIRAHSFACKFKEENAHDDLYCVDALRPSLQLLSHVGTIPVLNT